MTETKKPSDLIMERLEKIEKMLMSTISTPEHEPPKTQGTKELAIEHIDTCPTCRAQFKEKLRPEIMKEFKEKFKSKDLLTCDGCGEIVGKEEKDCPTCHGTHAH